MRTLSIFLLLLSLAIIADAKPDPSEKKAEAPKLDGVWLVVSMTRDGRPPPAETIKVQLKFQGTKLTMQTPDNEIISESDIVVDFKKRPVELDVIPPPFKGMRQQTIIQLDGDTLKWCVPKVGNPRPKDFEGGKDLAVFVLKRSK